MSENVWILFDSNEIDFMDAIIGIYKNHDDAIEMEKSLASEKDKYRYLIKSWEVN